MKPWVTPGASVRIEPLPAAWHCMGRRSTVVMPTIARSLHEISLRNSNTITFIYIHHAFITFIASYVFD